MNLGRLLFSPRGRIDPPTWWKGFAILSVLSIAVMFAPRVGGVLWLATFVPWALLTTKRLHDIGVSGWFQLVAVAVNAGIVLVAMLLMGAAVFLTLITEGAVQATLDAGAVAGATSTLLLTAGLLAFNTFWLIWLGGRPGSPGENRYGRPPSWPD